MVMGMEGRIWYLGVIMYSSFYHDMSSRKIYFQSLCMAYFNKIGLLLLNDDQSKFLVCEKDNFTSDFIMPGWRLEEGEDDIACIVREITEELDVKLDVLSLRYINDYTDVAAGDQTKDVSIKLYEGNIIGEPKPSNEIIKFYWIGKDDMSHPRLSPIIKNKIMPDLIAKSILK